MSIQNPVRSLSKRAAVPKLVSNAPKHDAKEMAKVDNQPKRRAGRSPCQDMRYIEEEREEKRRGRPPSESSKRLITLRLDPEVIAKFRATGDGWMTRINEALKAAKL